MLRVANFGNGLTDLGSDADSSGGGINIIPFKSNTCFQAGPGINPACS
jgi:hypothetical protein